MAQSRSAKTIILASGQGLTRLVGIVTAAVLARLFSQGDYATYRQTILAYTFAAPFVMLGFNRALFFFLPTERRRQRGVLIENLLLLAAGGLLLSVFLAAGGNEWLARRFNNPDLATTLLILVPYPLLMLPAASLGACLLARDRVGQVAAYNVASRLFMLLAVVVPCLIWPRPAVAVAATVAAALLSAVAALVLMFRACPTGNWRPTRSGLRRQISYSVPLGLAALAGKTSRSIGSVLVAARCAPETFAIYVNGAIEIPLIGIVTGSVTSVLLVDYVRLYDEGRLSEIIGLIHRAMVKTALILIPAMAFLLCMAPEVMRLLFGTPYEGSAVPFRIYLLLLPVRTLTFGAILQAAGKSHLVLIQALLAMAANATLAWCAIGWFGANGAATAAVIVTYFISVPYLVVMIKSLLRVPISRLFPWQSLLKVGLVSAAGALPIVLAKPYFAGWPDALVLAATTGGFGVLTLTLFSLFRLASFSQLVGWIRQIGKA